MSLQTGGHGPPRVTPECNRPSIWVVTRQHDLVSRAPQTMCRRGESAWQQAGKAYLAGGEVRGLQAHCGEGFPSHSIVIVVGLLYVLPDGCSSSCEPV